MLVHLATLEMGTRVTSAELGEVCDVPRGNVPTIVNRLSRAGILSCTPGRSGGCSLAREPSAISTLEIIEALDGAMEESNCLLDGRRCDDKDAQCVMHPTWVAGRQAMIDSFVSTSLADLARRAAISETDGDARVS
ncbi:MAG: Rrf2 family transcriptional regulator [Actinomycetia bacterium]|nr:Rrf2 family transcriptional regulator [Actinomycetes bacterium]MCP4087134.1 Rrf2 family transcriptional regulator [Actinomycetes bacterium]